MKRRFSFLLILVSFLAFSQREGAIWYFGENAGLDFTAGVPVSLTNGALLSNEGSAVISDSEGNLLFYTNGNTVWNRNHQVMSNGTGIIGDVSSTQSAIIVPLPNSANTYYIFTVGNENSPDGLNYSIVDMSSSGGLGAVTSKNVLLNSPVTEKLTAVSHANGTDVWIIAHESNNDVFVAYILTENGLAPNPSISPEGLNLSELPSDPARNNAVGYLKSSPQGNQLAICHKGFGVQLLLFDSESGEVNFPITISTNRDAYGVEFSPSGEVLYVSIEGGIIMQYDLTVADISRTETVVTGTEFDTGALQLGLDGKIYVANYLKPHLSVINNPDVLGQGCNFSYGTVDLGGQRSALGLPNFVQSFFVGYITAENFCLGSPTDFLLDVNQTVTNMEWDFGDGTVVSGTESISHTYQQAGEFKVSVRFESDNQIRTEYKFVTINPTPIAYTPETQYVCSTDPSFSYDLRELTPMILNGQDSFIYDVSYHLSRDEAISGTDGYRSSYAGRASETTLFARVFVKNASSCFSITDVQLINNIIPEIPLEPYYFICANDSELVLDGGDFQSWNWQDSEGNVLARSRMVTLTEPGPYSLTVTYSDTDFCCESRFEFELVPANPIQDFSFEIIGFGEISQIRVHVVGEGEYRYAIDDGPYQPNAVIGNVSPGRHILTVADITGCELIKKEVIVLGYPKFFTPNADGYNDNWSVQAASYFPTSRTRIFNRYGQFIKELGKDEAWDGTMNGRDLPLDTYWFSFELDNDKTRNGYFVLKR